MEMKIALASDLHLEFGDIDLKNEGDAEVLILSGDIMITQDLYTHPADAMPSDVSKMGTRQAAAYRYRNFLTRISAEFPHIIAIAGNHEFYYGRWRASLDHLRKEYDRFPNIYFLEDQSKIINDHLFMGATLWTNCNKSDPMTFNAIGYNMNDFHEIRVDSEDYRKLKPRDTVIRHYQTLERFRDILSNPQHTDMKAVVVGHHAPSSMSVHEMYRGDFLGNGAYYSDLSNFILDHPQIVLWTHGHTHFPFDYKIGDTRVVCNPRGYIGYEPAAAKFKLQYLDI